MEESPLISVIVPVYNTEKYLIQCIESILNQTFTDFELLLINDGSTDNSGNICDEYAKKDKRILVFHKENGGVSSSRNLGLENAQGEWITFIDSDDWIDNYLFEIYINHIAENIDSIVIGFIEEYGDRTSIITLSENKILNMIDALILLEHSKYYGFVWNRVYKSSIIKQNQIIFDNDISYCEDHLFTYEYNKYCSKIYILKDIPYHHRILENGSLSKKFSFDILIDEAEKEKKICQSIYEENPNPDFLRIFNNTYKGRLLLSINSIFNENNNLRERLRKFGIIRKIRKKNMNYTSPIFSDSYLFTKILLGEIKRINKNKFFCRI